MNVDKRNTSERGRWRNGLRNRRKKERAAKQWSEKVFDRHDPTQKSGAHRAETFVDIEGRIPLD